MLYKVLKQKHAPVYRKTQPCTRVKQDNYNGKDMGNHYNRLLGNIKDIISEEIRLHSDLGQDTFQ